MARPLLSNGGEIRWSDFQTEFGGVHPISISEYRGSGDFPASGAIRAYHFYTNLIPSSALFTTTGSHTWTVPSGVTSISVVVVGGGGSGHAYFGSGGAGGGLAYKNNIAVSPGDSITVYVGAGGAPYPFVGYSTSQGVTSTYNGESSYVTAGSTTVTATGGNHGYGCCSAPTTLPTVGAPSGTYDGGGNGGTSQGNYSRSGYQSSGGGGAGGYSGNGGDGAGSQSSNGYLVNATAGSGGGGGGGGSRLVNTNAASYGGSGGGGVDVYGEGTSGAAGTTDTSTSPYTVVTTTGGGGGSGGDDGLTSSTTQTGGAGGGYGAGGGSGHGSASTSYGGAGGQGAVRIIWGTGRAFPSTNVTNASNDATETVY